MICLSCNVAKRRVIVTTVSLLITLVSIAAKYYVYSQSHSVAISAELSHSMIDLLIVSVSYLATYLRFRISSSVSTIDPIKLEDLMTMINVMLLALTGAFIISESLRSGHSHFNAQLDLKLVVVTSLSFLLNASVYFVLKRHQSDDPVIETNTIHFLADMLGSIVALVGFIMSSIGYRLMDKISAVIVGIIVVREAVLLGKKTVLGIIDYVPHDVVSSVSKAISLHGIKIESIKSINMRDHYKLLVETKEMVSPELAASISQAVARLQFNKVVAEVVMYQNGFGRSISSIDSHQ